MVLGNFLLIALAVLVIIIAWAIFKRLFKIAMYTGGTIFLIIAITTAFLVMDIKDYSLKFEDSGKKIILVDGDDVLTGFRLNNGVEYLDDYTLESLSGLLQEGSYDELLGADYKVLVFRIEAIESIKANEFMINNIPLSREDALNILRSGMPYAMLNEKGLTSSGSQFGLEDKEENSKAKAGLFGTILSDYVFGLHDPLFLFSQVKEKNIYVYPDTILFKTARLVPLSFIERAISKAKEAVQEE